MKRKLSVLFAILAIALLIYIPLTVDKASSQSSTSPNPAPKDTVSLDTSINPFSNTSTFPGLGRQPKNVQVLKGLTNRELGQKMREAVTGLGVQCDFCHNRKDYSSDEKKKKLTARKMFQMVQDINNKYLQDVVDVKVTCYTCHQGHEEPPKPPKNTGRQEFERD